MATELLAPDELPDLIESDDYKALPFDQRQKVLTGALGEAHQWQAANGGWTPDSWKQFGELASVARQRVTESETLGEKAKHVAGTIGKVVKDSGVSLGLMAAASQPGMEQVVPVGKNLVANLERAGQAGMEKLRQSAGPETNWLEGDLKGLKKDIDEGNIPFGDQAKLDEWLHSHDDTISKDAAAYQVKVGKQTPEQAAQWSRDSGLLGNPKNAALLASYMQTRDPAALEALRSNLLTTQGRSETAAAQAKMNKESLGGKMLDATGIGSEMLAEAGDPLEVAGMVLPVIKGAKIVQKGVSVGRKLGTVAAATAGEVASELGSQFIDDPNATWEQRAQVAKETLYGTLGLAGIGAAAGKVLQAKEPPVAAQSPEAVLSSATPPPLPVVTDTPSAVPDLQEHTGDLTAEDVADLEAPPVVAWLSEPGQFDNTNTAPTTEGDVMADFGIQLQQATEDLAVVEAAHAAGQIDDATLAEAQAGFEQKTQAQPWETDLFGAPIEQPSTSFLDTVETQEVPIAELSLSKDVPQFKEGADSAGVVEPLVGKYDRLGTGPIIVWERANGAREVISGRHRFDLAKRTGELSIPAQVVREADGFTRQHAITTDAELNIRDGQGSIKDYANYIRNAGLTETEAEQRGIRARAKGRSGWTIGTQAGETVFELHANDKLTDQAAEQIARAAPGNEALQRIGAQSVLDGGSIDLSVNLMRVMQSEIGTAPQGTQLDLFGKDDSAMQAMRDQARRAAKIQSGIREQVSAAAGAAKNPKAAAKLGVNVNDPAAVQAKLTELRAELARWENWPMHEDLRAQVKNGGAGFKNLDTSGKTAGFLNADIINEGVDLIARGVRDFAAWARAMINKFGAAIRDYLQGVWQAAMKTSQQGSIGGDPLRRKEGDAGGGGAADQRTDGMRETRSRFARPDEAERLYQVRADQDVKAAASAWVDSVSLADAVAQLESGALPDGMTDDVGQRAAAEVLMRTGEIMRSGTEVQRLQARSLSHRMGKVWQGWMSQEAGRNLRQRAVANAELQPFAPILAAENVLIDRADAVVTKRFEGGAAEGAQKVKKVADDAGTKAGENLGADLDAEARPASPEERQTREPTSKKNPALAQMLNDLRRKMFPGMKWADIFMDLPSAQKERQRAIYQRLQLDERLKGLSAAERLALTNELDKAWQRERRKVFNRELEKAGVLGEKDATDRAKVKKAMPRLLRMINLGMMNSEMFREAIAPEYGLRMLSGDEALKLRALAEDAWKLPEGVLRNRKLGDLLAGIQHATGASTAELLNHYWVASVLSGLRTMFDTFMSSMNGFGNNLIQAGHLIATGKGKAAVAAHMQWWAGLSQGVSESLQILAKGDYSYLKRFNEDMRRALDGEGTFRPVPLGESLWKNGSWWQKYGMAPVMIWTGRLMAAADHINNTATSQGAMASARALHPELYKGAHAWTDAERMAARKQAMREVTGGGEPTSREDAATISARTREILNGNVSPETRAEGNFIGDQAAYQNDPIGILGGIYQMMNAGLGTGERVLQGVADKIGGDGRAGAFAKAALTWASGALRSVAGAKFIRFGANFGNDMMGYMPGTYLLSRGGQALDLIDRTRSQNALLLGKNTFGLVAASTVAAMFADKDDDEEGWHLEGSWNGMTPEQKAQRRTAGMEPLSFWKRNGSKVQRVSYRSWPTAGIFVAVGSMADERRFDPVKFKHRGPAGHLLHAVTAGALQVKDVNAVRGLAELFGASALSSDPEADFMERLLKLPFNYVGGVVPTAVKDLDAIRDPHMYQPEGVFEELARNVPGVRQQVSGGRPKLNKLGEPIELDRKPWSRAYTDVESGLAHRVLGSLLARGLDLPSASSDRLVFNNGARVPLKSLGADVEYKFQRRVGEGYRAWLASDEGRELITLPVEQAARVIDRKAATIKMMAATAATGK